MIRRPPRSTRTDTLFPYTTLFRSGVRGVWRALRGAQCPGVRADQAEPLPLRRAGRRLAQGCGGRADYRSKHQARGEQHRSEEHTSELQSLMRISYAVFCLKKKIRTENEIDIH